MPHRKKVIPIQEKHRLLRLRHLRRRLLYLRLCVGRQVVDIDLLVVPEIRLSLQRLQQERREQPVPLVIRRLLRLPGPR